MAFMDQSKLSLEGQSKSQKLKTGKKRKVKVRVSMDSDADAGLSAFANAGEENPITFARMKRRKIAAAASVNKLLTIWFRFSIIFGIFFRFSTFTKS